MSDDAKVMRWRIIPSRPGLVRQLLHILMLVVWSSTLVGAILVVALLLADLARGPSKVGRGGLNIGHPHLIQDLDVPDEDP